jgi:hypothetical protein
MILVLSFPLPRGGCFGVLVPPIGGLIKKGGTGLQIHKF